MLEVALREKLEWTTERIQSHCKVLWKEPIEALSELGFLVEPEDERAYHLMGLRVPERTDVLKIQQALAERKVIVAARGQGIRVSPHLYNTEEDMAALVAALRAALR